MKLFASDLDGTLLAINHKGDDEINAMLDKVCESGNIFAIATGRMLNRATPDEFNRSVYQICNNGAIITDDKGTIIYRDIFNKDALWDLLNLDEYDFDFMTARNTYKKTSREQWIEDRKSFKPPKWANEQEENEDWHKKLMSDMIQYVIFSQTKEDIFKQDIVKVNLHLRNKVVDRTRINDLLKKYEGIIVNAPCDDGLYEITNYGTDKGSAVAKVASLFHIKDEDVYTYGDGGNDVPMLERFENSYAPCNGMDIAKNAAKQIIGDHRDHSVSKHIVSIIDKK